MSLAQQTHPELEIVCRILQQASVPFVTTDQFDQQWTPTYLHQAFQWTDHLSAQLLLPAAATGYGNSDNEPQPPLPPPPPPAAIIRSFFDALQTLPSSNNAPGLMPLQEELMSPSTALRRRLLSNPGISDSARMVVLCMDGSSSSSSSSGSRSLSSVQPLRWSLSHDAVAMICDNAIDNIVAGLRPHFSRLQNDDDSWVQDHVASTLSEQTIDRKAKARVIYHKVSSPSNPMSVDAAVYSLREYLEAWHAEAAEVINYLLDMVTAHRQQGCTQDAVQVDWKAFVDALSQLVHDDRRVEIRSALELKRK